MRYIPLILWVLLFPLYFWIWNSSKAQCCSAASGGTEITTISSSDDGGTESATTGISSNEVNEESDELSEEDASSRIIDSEDKEAIAAESSAAATKAEETKEVTVVETVDMGLFYFPYNSDQANYGAQSENYLRKVARIANESGKRIILTGHTDNRGDAASNMTLGQQRADEVKRKLISLGVPAGKIVANSKGETDPTATNDTASGRQQNRRVELILE